MPIELSALLQYSTSDYNIGIWNVSLKDKFYIILVIKLFDRDLRQVGGFLRVSSTNKTDRYDITENIVESGIKHQKH